jgi:hypothetical protein
MRSFLPSVIRRPAEPLPKSLVGAAFVAAGVDPIVKQHMGMHKNISALLGSLIAIFGVTVFDSHNAAYADIQLTVGKPTKEGSIKVKIDGRIVNVDVPPGTTANGKRDLIFSKLGSIGATKVGGDKIVSPIQQEKRIS